MTDHFIWILDSFNRVDQQANEILDHDIERVSNVHSADLKPLVNSHTKGVAQIKWDADVHDRDLYPLKPTLQLSKKSPCRARAEEVAFTWLIICHTKANKSHFLCREPRLFATIVARRWPLESSIWYEWPDIHYSSWFIIIPKWYNYHFKSVTTTYQYLRGW